MDWNACFVLTLTSANLYKQVDNIHPWRYNDDICGFSFSFSLTKLKRNANQQRTKEVRFEICTSHDCNMQLHVDCHILWLGKCILHSVIEISRSETNATLTYMYINCITLIIILFVVNIGTDHTSNNKSAKFI